MPVTWNAETEARLLAGLFKVCDIKVGTKQLQELADIVGQGCTPKAVTHRLAKFRKQVGAFNGGSKGKTATATPPSKKRERSTPRSAKGSAGKDFVEDDEDDDEDDEPIYRAETPSVKKIKKEEDLFDGAEDFLFKVE